VNEGSNYLECARFWNGYYGECSTSHNVYCKPKVERIEDK